MKKILIPLLLFISVTASAQYRALIEKDTVSLVGTKSDLIKKADTSFVNSKIAAIPSENFDPATKADLTKVVSDSNILATTKANINNSTLTGTATLNSDTLMTKTKLQKGGWMSEYANDSLAVTVGGLGLNNIYKSGGYLKVVSTLPQSPFLTNLAAYYKLDEASGNAVDNVSGNNGTVAGATYYVTGKIGTAYQFAGTGGITLPNNSITTFGTSDFSINMWVYLTSVDGTNGALIGGQSNAFALVIQGADKSLRVQKVNVAAGGQSSTPLTLNTWQMITVTSNGTTGSVNYYINGVSAGSSTFSQSYTGASNYIGTSTGTVTSPTGKIDEVGYWKKVLSSTDITTLYNSGSGKTYPF
jgi:hypothetical protein